MTHDFLSLARNGNSVENYINSIRQRISLAVFGVPESFKNFLSSIMNEKVLIIEKDVPSCINTLSAVKEFTDKKAVYIPSKDETLVMRKAFSKDTYFERIVAIEQLKDADIIICTAESVMQLFPKTVSHLLLKKEMKIDLQNIVKTLIDFGYKKTDKVESKATFSVRGDILDVFTIDGVNPIRIDFFGDEIESIKSFDIESGKNLGFITEVKIVQAVEFNFLHDDLKLFTLLLEKEVAICEKEQKTRLKVLAEDLMFAIDNKDVETLSILAPLSEDAGNIFDILDKNCVVILNEPKKINDIMDLTITEFTERHRKLAKDGETFSFTCKNLLSKEQFVSEINQYVVAAFSGLQTSIPLFNPLKLLSPDVSAIFNYRVDRNGFYNDIVKWQNAGYKIVVFTGNKKNADKFACDLSIQNIPYSLNENSDNNDNNVIIIPKELKHGFIFNEEKLVIIGNGNLYSQNTAEKKQLVRKQNFFTAPTVGDYCVHEVHGVGRVVGNKKISSTEGTKDYVSVEYYGGDILYIPVEQMDILTRYLGSSKSPKLSKIGGKDFAKIKERARESIKKMSFNLKKLYGQRQKDLGFQFKVDEELMNAFNGQFEFAETPDQRSAESDIENDMKSSKVMDRLICGDVGFGKTEVAFRAAFIAISNGKQVVMLAPTTILTEQHYNTAIKRFEGFGFNIACLNRFRSQKEQKEILDKLRDGKIDFIIGTHRLISPDIDFKDLGLLVLDEEQRFGVEHKEKIKLLKKNVDTITLTATPIPRTLHLSLSGIRPISVINTPPLNRLPVQTYVTEETDGLIKDAVEREINRGGQAFILYNRVETIFEFAEKIKIILPNIKLTVVHGRMDEKVLEDSIMGFYRGESEVLISTTIIENGIDLPRANTLIVIDADKIGLSTLYQLKGRVGRSDRIAYAYFTFKREKVLTDTAYERLNAITEFAEMGSGIKVAMRDLEIRGAGNVLGVEQHGHMDNIGYELYSKLLREELFGEEDFQPELDIRVTAYIPEKYIESTGARMDAYKEIAEINSHEAEQEFLLSVKDAYGEIPQETLSLIDIAVVKFLASKIKVTGVTVTMSQVFLSFASYRVFSDENLRLTMDEYGNKIRISMSSVPKIEFLRNNETNYEMLKMVRAFLVSAVNKIKK